MSTEYHVSKTGSNSFDGTREHPFLTIQAAADVARPGDTVTVHEGVYRECVDPVYGGISDSCRITYRAAEGEKVVIKGSEVVTNWENAGGTVWMTQIDNRLFGSYNPFAAELGGDWFMDPLDYPVHSGDVYLNGKSLYEASSLEAVRNPVMRVDGFNPPWTNHREPILHPEDTLSQWFAEVHEDETVLYADFRGADPNRETVEINVRMCCFYPSRTGVNYLTVRGFEMCHAATPWAPPTADQPGLIGAHWSKGWIIEQNCIHDSKCSGISIGKEISTGHNDRTRYKRKAGYQYQMEAVFKALNIGWNKETIGSHVIRDNTIYDCGQNAIVGHLGCIFSRICHNHIYNIATKHEFYGYEIAGIKLHAAIDVQIEDNNIHDCTLGIWLDWQAQGARVTRNLFHRNDRDLFIEVTHGPHLVDNNIFASEYFFDNIAWGGAYVNNLILGTMRRENVLNRATPYHFPHSTTPKGTTFVYGGDDRWFQNIFVGGAKTYTEQSISGTSDYDGASLSLQEFADQIHLEIGDLESFGEAHEPVYLGNNAYLKGATMFDREEGSLRSGYDPEVHLSEADGQVWLELTVSPELAARQAKVLTSADLGSVRIVEACYENPDGSPVILDRDYTGAIRNAVSSLGPIAGLKEGRNRIPVWNGV